LPPKEENNKTVEIPAAPEKSEPVEEEKPQIEAVQPVSEPVTDSGFSFAVIGDTQTYSGSPYGPLASAVKNIKNSQANLIFAVGDLVSSCDEEKKCEAKYDTWKSALGSLMNRTYAAQGNHDRTGGSSADRVWQKVFNFPTNGPAGFSELVYSLDHGDSHFVVLASDNPGENKINSTQRSWLEQDLARSKKTNKFVFFHEPAYPVSSKIGESLDVNNKERNALWDIFEKYGVTAVFSGHEHIHSRKNINGIYQFGIGDTDMTAHAAPKPGAAEFSYVGHHYGIVAVKGKAVNVKIYNTGGGLINSFDFSK
jgi:UDP-2,3-diacylglucosamine pyrophosphatase LpxH